MTEAARGTAPALTAPASTVSLDIIIPAHNEEHRIDPTLDSYRSHFPDSRVRFLVALDSCQDATADIVARHAAEDPRVELHSYAKLGKGGVIRRAFEHCRADFVAFVDADGSTAPEELARLAVVAMETDGAIASRHLPGSSVQGRRDFGRTTASTAFAWMVRRLFDLPFRDTQCGAKVVRRDALGRLLARVTSNDLLFDLDLLLQAHRSGLEIVEVPSVWVARAGSQVKMARELGQVTGSLFRLWRTNRYPVSPLASGSAIGVVWQPKSS